MLLVSPYTLHNQFVPACQVLFHFLPKFAAHGNTLLPGRSDQWGVPTIYPIGQNWVNVHPLTNH